MALGYKQYQLKLLKYRALLGLILIACVLVAWSVFTRFQVEREMAARREAVEAEYQDLEARYANLKAEVEYLTDERSIESEIRKHFDVAKEGESVVIIMDSERTNEPEPEPVAPPTPPAPWWQFWR
jgi:cell division protein FtsB